MSRKPIHMWYAPILALTVFLLYSVTLGHGFVWDDHVYIIGNKAYQNFDLARIFASLANRVEYLPLRDVTLAMDYHFWGESSFGFHLTNVLLFTCNIFLIYLFAAELPFAGDDIKVRKQAAFLTALLFGVHPLLSESVNLIAFRNVLLSGAAFFLATYLYARDQNSGKPFSLRTPLLLSFCFLAALLSKATTIILPCALILLALTIPSRRTIGQQAAALAPLCVMSAFFFMFYRAVASGSRIINNQLPVPLSAKIAIALQIPFFYLHKALVPLGYSAEYAADGFSQVPASPAVVLSGLGLMALSVIAVVLRRRMPVVGFALLWFGITLLPVLNFFATNPIVADRYAYLPAFAIMYLTAVALIWWKKKNPAYAAATVVALAAALGITTFARSLDWRSDIALWQANIKTEPSNAKGYENLIAEALIKGDYSLAQEILAEGRSRAPSPTYFYLEGKMHYLRHDPAAALRAFKEAVRQDSAHIRSLFNIGMIYEEMGDFRKAEEYYRRTLAANAPDGWGCREQARIRLEQVRRISELQR